MKTMMMKIIKSNRMFCMKNILILVACIFAASCVPKVEIVNHIVIDNFPENHITEEKSPGFEGAKFWKTFEGEIPVGYRVTEEDYEIRINIPLASAGNNIQIGIDSFSKEILFLDSVYLHYNKEFESRPYTFYLDKFPNIRELSIDVKKKNGNVIGQHTIQFSLVNIGYLYSGDAI